MIDMKEFAKKNTKSLANIMALSLLFVIMLLTYSAIDLISFSPTLQSSRLILFLATFVAMSVMCLYMWRDGKVPRTLRFWIMQASVIFVLTSLWLTGDILYANYQHPEATWLEATFNFPHPFGASTTLVVGFVGMVGTLVSAARDFFEEVMKGSDANGE